MRNIVRSIVTAAFFLLISLSFMPAAALAAQPQGVFDGACNSGASSSTVCSSSQQAQTPQNNSFYGPNGLLIKVANIIAIATAVIAVIVIIVAGLRYVISSGDSSKVSEAKDAILYALIGLVVIALARSIIGLVVSRL